MWISIGSGTTIEEWHLAVEENGSKIKIGQDCKFSSNIRLSTTDLHFIIVITAGNRTKPAQDFTIVNHVLLGYYANVNKEVIIGYGLVIAGHSVVTKSMESNFVAAGIPTRVVRNSNIME